MSSACAWAMSNRTNGLRWMAGRPVSRLALEAAQHVFGQRRIQVFRQDELAFEQAEPPARRGTCGDGDELDFGVSAGSDVDRLAGDGFPDRPR